MRPGQSGSMRRTFSRKVSLPYSLSDLDNCPGHETTVLITGGNQGFLPGAGIGLQVAKQLAAAGCRVIITSRDLNSGQSAAKEISSVSQDGKMMVTALQMDLADLDSIAAFVAKIQDEKLDIIICNAGLMCPPYSLTKQGFESTLGVNHHGHFYLMQLLTPKLKTQRFKSRVVVVSSAKYLGSKGLNLDDLHYKQPTNNYKASKAYDDSKLACILFAKEYDRRHSNTTAVAVDPGRCTSTKLTRNLGMTGSLSSMAYRTVSKSVEEAASSVLYAAVSRDLATGKGGSYIEDCHVQETNSLASNMELAAKLWEVTENEIQTALKN